MDDRSIPLLLSKTCCSPYGGKSDTFLGHEADGVVQLLRHVVLNHVNGNICIHNTLALTDHGKFETEICSLGSTDGGSKHIPLSNEKGR